MRLYIPAMQWVFENAGLMCVAGCRLGFGIVYMAGTIVEAFVTWVAVFDIERWPPSSSLFHCRASLVAQTNLQRGQCQEFIYFIVFKFEYNYITDSSNFPFCQVFLFHFAIL